MGVRRTIEHLTAIDPHHPEIAAWKKVAADRGSDTQQQSSEAFGQRERPETALTLFILGKSDALPEGFEEL